MTVDAFVVGTRYVGRHPMRTWSGAGVVGYTRGVQVLDVELDVHHEVGRQSLAIPITDEGVALLHRLMDHGKRPPRLRMTIEVVP